MSTRNRKVLLAIPSTIVALTLSVASVAFACTTMGGQTYLDKVNGNNWSYGTSIKRNATLTVRGTGLRSLNSLGQKINHMFLQDGNAMYCHLGSEPLNDAATGNMVSKSDTRDISTLTSSSSFDVSAMDVKASATLRGGMFLCWGDWSYSAWPVEVQVT